MGTDVFKEIKLNTKKYGEQWTDIFCKFGSNLIADIETLLSLCQVNTNTKRSWSDENKDTTLSTSKHPKTYPNWKKLWIDSKLRLLFATNSYSITIGLCFGFCSTHLKYLLLVGLKQLLNQNSCQRF